MNRNCEAEKRAGPCGYMLNANHAYRGHIEGTASAGTIRHLHELSNSYLLSAEF